MPRAVYVHIIEVVVDLSVLVVACARMAKRDFHRPASTRELTLNGNCISGLVLTNITEMLIRWKS